MMNNKPEYKYSLELNAEQIRHLWCAMTNYGRMIHDDAECSDEHYQAVWNLLHRCYLLTHMADSDIERDNARLLYDACISGDWDYKQFVDEYFDS